MKRGMRMYLYGVKMSNRSAGKALVRPRPVQPLAVHPCHRLSNISFTELRVRLGHRIPQVRMATPQWFEALGNFLATREETSALLKHDVRAQTTAARALSSGFDEWLRQEEWFEDSAIGTPRLCHLGDRQVLFLATFWAFWCQMIWQRQVQN